MVKKLANIALFGLLFFGVAEARERYNGVCHLRTIDTVTTSATEPLRAASCSVTVFDVGTANLSSICSDDLSTCTPLANPFTADANGEFFFYADDAIYDVRLTGGTPAIGTVNISVITLGGGGIIDKLTEKSGRMFDVTAYGATLDDSSDDDIAAIQAAVDAANTAGGGVVYFPEGTFHISPSSQSDCIVPKSNVHFMGAGYSSIILVKASNGAFQAVFCNTTTDITNVTFARFTIDTNIANNLNTVSSSVPNQQIPIQWHAGHNLNIYEMKILYSGVHGLSLNGVTVKDVKVVRNRLEYKRDTGITGIDNTGIYTDGNRVVVEGNVLIGLRVPFALTGTPNGSSMGCMEAHAGPTVFANNHCKDFSTGQHSISYSQSHPGPFPAENLIVHVGNTCEDCNNCHLLASIDSRNLDGVAVVGNTCNLLQKTWNQNASVGISLNDLISAGIDGDYENVVISGNTIDFEDEGTGRSGLSDSAMCGICIAPQGNVQNAIVSGNVITDAPSMGIRVGNLGSTVDADYTNILIADNVLRNYGQNKLNTFFRMGMRTEGDIIGLTVRGNRFTQTSTDEIDIPAINMVTASGPNNTSYRDCVFLDNDGADFSTLDTASPCEYEPEQRFVKYSATFSGATLTPTVDGTYRVGELVGNTAAVVDGYSMRTHVVTALGTVRTLVGSPTCSSVAGSTTTTLSDASEHKIHDIITCGACTERKEVLRIIGNTMRTDISTVGSCSGSVVFGVVATRPGGLIQTGQPVLTTNPYTIGVMTGGEGVPPYATGTMLVGRNNAVATDRAILALLGGTTGRAGITFGSQTAAEGATVEYFPASDTWAANNQLVSLGPNTAQAPRSVVEIFGSLSLPLLAINVGGSPYTMLSSDFGIEANAVGGNITINLPAALGVDGRVHWVCKTDASGNTVTIDPNGAEIINTAATHVLTAVNQCVAFQSNGVGWRIFATQP